MKKDVALTLLKQMKDANLTEEDIKILTKLDEDVLKLLSQINSGYLTRVINILKDYSHKEQVELLSVLKETKDWEDMLNFLEIMVYDEYSLTIAGAKTINNSNHRFLAKYVGELLTNEEHKVYYLVRRILCFRRFIAAGIPHIRCGGRTGTAAHAHTGNGGRISARTSCRWYNGSGVASSQ